MTTRSTLFVYALVAFGVGCTFSGLPQMSEQRGITYNEPQVGVAHAEERYLRSTEYFFDGFPEDCVRYVEVDFNVKEGEPRTDRELLLQSLEDTMAEHMDKIEKLREAKGGQCDWISFVVFRNRHDVGGRYTAGIVVPLAEFLDPESSAQGILDASRIHTSPLEARKDLRNWYTKMAIEHQRGEFHHRL